MVKYIERYKKFIKNTRTGELRLFKGNKALLLSIYYSMSKNVVNNDDVASGYNNISETYHNWTGLMGKHSEKIVEKEMFVNSESFNVLDLACGQGFITRKILEKFDNQIKFSLKCVDISSKMLDVCKARNNYENVDFINSEAYSYLLQQKNESIDMIFFGWALGYFDYNKILKLINTKLKPNGYLCIITNGDATFSEFEDYYIEVIVNDYKNLNKVFEASFELPKDKHVLNKWMEKYHFDVVKSDDGNECLTFDKPEECFYWLKNAGVLAGTDKIFKNQKRAERMLIDLIGKYECRNNKYHISPSYIHGIYKKVGA